MQNTQTLPPIILASTSIFRRQLLKKLNLNFEVYSPNIKEQQKEKESVRDMVKRLSKSKSDLAKTIYKKHIIIASDQSAELNGNALGKPYDFDNALKQLQEIQGKTITFYTGLSVVNTLDKQEFFSMDITKVHFRNLKKSTLENYLKIEQPLECAGSFKSEGLGITLIKKIESKDPNSLIGLPLIELTTILKKMGYEIPMKIAAKPLRA